MDVLFIGGSRFVGKHTALEAARRGHSLTFFNRGTQPLPVAGARHIRGDRNSDIGRLRGERFDAVVDTSGYLPRQVRSAVAALAGGAATYLFVSTISVYADRTRPYQGEEAPLVELADPNVEEMNGETYGGLKALCERTLAESFPGRRLVVRPGLIVGPDDPTDRFSYWPVRLRRGGEFVAPGGPDEPLQWIDVRDLASWLVSMLERGEQGTYNAVSEADRFTLGGLLEDCREVSGSDARPVWLDERFLLEQGVKPFSDLPLWIPGEDANLLRIDASRARDAGLSIRDASDSVAATLEWFGDDREMKAGLQPDRERQLLLSWLAHDR